MNYNFDEIIDRRGTDSVKWDGTANLWGRSDLLPMWVADMDFRTPPFILDALHKRLDHEVLGYTFACEDWYESIIKWVEKHHDWHITRDMFTYTPGIVRGLAYAIQAFTMPADKILVTTPVYHPFFLVSEHLGRTVVYHSLDLEDGQYRIDFDRFRKDVQGCKLFILSNPHNPGGRVWTREELKTIASVCAESGTLVISDEIHADLTLPGYHHVSFATVSDEALHNSLTFMSPSKAFNMAGLSSSYCIVEDKALRDRFFGYLSAGEFNEGHLFAYLSVAAAYMQGEDWLRQMINYLQGNIDYTGKFIADRIPGLRMIKPQASFLVFLDCRQWNLPQEALEKLFVDKAKLALNSGTTFGKEGEGFMRLNIACPRSVLQTALEKLAQVCNESIG